MSELGQVWQTLRDCHLEGLAPLVLQLGIRSCNELALQAADFHNHGVSQHQVEVLLQQLNRHQEPRAQSQRADFPVINPWIGKASFVLALQAGHPNNRKRALDALDSDILARSTNPSVASRLRTWRALAAVWEVPPWPLHVDTVRCIGASLKAGGYRSAALYFSAAIQHQIRDLGEPNQSSTTRSRMW